MKNENANTATGVKALSIYMKNKFVKYFVIIILIRKDLLVYKTPRGKYMTYSKEPS